LHRHSFIAFDELQSYPNPRCWDFFIAAAAAQGRKEVWAIVDPSQAVKQSNSGLPPFSKLVGGGFHYVFLNQVVRNGNDLFATTKKWALKSARRSSQDANNNWVRGWKPHPRNSVAGSVQYLADTSVVEAIQQLLQDGLAAADLAILVRNQHEALSEVADELEAAGMAWRRADDQSDEEGPTSCVTVESVHRFKGLDAPFVILVAPAPEYHNVAAFVCGFSRAMVKCVVLGSEQDLQAIRSLQLRAFGESALLAQLSDDNGGYDDWGEDDRSDADEGDALMQLDGDDDDDDDD
jgi:hypothetical protein